MDLRDRLRTASPATAPTPEDARRVFERGRRRRRGRWAAGVGTAAIVVVAGVAAWPGAGPGVPVVDDDIEVAAPPPAEPDLTPEPDAAPDRVEDLPTDDESHEKVAPPAPALQHVRVGKVVLTVPEGVELVEAATGPEPCPGSVERPTLVVLETLSAEPPDEPCLQQSAAATLITAVPSPGVPPAMRPGHADIDGELDVEETELLGAWGVLEHDLGVGTGGEGDSAVPGTTYLFPDLELYLDVRAPDATAGFVDELFASATRVDDGGDDEDPEIDAPTDDEGDVPVRTVDDEASTADRSSAPSGPADLVLTDIRVGTHEGFDRVTLEFEGEGTAGWFTRIGTQAIQDGSGASVAVEGDAVLDVMVNMLAFPPQVADEPMIWRDVRIVAPSEAAVLTEVVGSVWFEGQQQVFIGLEEPTAYRIARLSDPQRVVIDLVHP